MRILWLCNIILPVVAEEIGSNKDNGGGWITGLSDNLVKEKDVDLAVCFPMYKGKSIVKGNAGKIKYYGFPKKFASPAVYDVDIEKYFKEILLDFKPDIVHIFGTEYPHSLSMAKEFNNPDKTIINIQGLCSIISKHYLNGIPTKTQRSYTFRDFLKHDNLINQQKTFEKRGVFEIEALRKVSHVVGRTTWDKACSLQINPDLKYHFCNETLRESFYHGEWNLDNVKKHSIFVSQSYYPVKGLHFMLEAMPLILKKYPDAHIYTTGESFMKCLGVKGKIRESSYQKYLRDLVIKNKLENNITFLGSLDEREMQEQYLKTHVFVSPSLIENESNSLSEAKILGVPSVCSYVGGVTDRLVDKKDGYFYQHDAPYMLAHYVCEVFGDDNLANEISINAKENAAKAHDRKKNLNDMIEIYRKIYSK